LLLRLLLNYLVLLGTSPTAVAAPASVTALTAVAAPKLLLLLLPLWFFLLPGLFFFLFSFSF
jgi:hypothetical protein